MRLTRRQLNVLIESLLYEHNYPYMSSQDEIAELEYERTGIHPDIKAAEEEFKEEEFGVSANALLNVLFAVLGIKLSMLTAVPALVGIGTAIIGGGLSIQGAYKAIVERFLGDKELVDQVPGEVSALLGVDDEVLELLDDDLVQALPTLYTDNVLTPATEAGKSLEDIIPLSEYLDEYLKTNSDNQLGLLRK